MERSSPQKIDIFAHIVPARYKKALLKMQSNTVGHATHKLEEVMMATPSLFDLDGRFRVLDKYEGLRQVLTVAAPPVEDVADPKGATELARLANDEMAELITKYPDRFAAAVACLPMNDIDAALRETDRAIRELHFKGIQIFTPTSGKPIDEPALMPLYEKMSEYDLPIWIHPARGRDFADYRSESHSKYWVFRTFGWPYETTVAMTRLVFSGVLEKYPNLKFITHHCGGMVPYFEDRIVGMYDYAAVCGAKYKQALSRPPIEYFRMFYGDTALYGDTPGLTCGYTFFGAEHIVFGTDVPYDSENGARNTRQTISAIESMSIPAADKKKIFEGNARRILKL